MAARKTPQVRKNPAGKLSAKTPSQNKARPGKMGISGDRKATQAARIKLGVNEKATKALLQSSYGAKVNAPGGVVSKDTAAVMGYFKGLSPKARKAAYKQLGDTIATRTSGGLAGGWGSNLTGVLFSDLPTEAKAAYAANSSRGGGAYGSALESAAGGPESFASGVSASTLEFIKEKGKSRFAEGESEAGKTGATKRKKAQRKKLVKRTVKKTNVKGKRVRAALRSPGVTKSDKAIYKKVAKQASPKLSSRLRAADRRKKK